jgi:hypothetical protein
MKAISIHQPEASLLLHGFIRYHQRAYDISTPTTLLIHASARILPRDQQLFEHRWVRDFFRRKRIFMIDQLPLAGIIGSCTVMSTHLSSNAIANDLPFTRYDSLFSRLREHHFLFEIADQRRISTWPCRGEKDLFEVQPPDYVMGQLFPSLRRHPCPTSSTSIANSASSKAFAPPASV